jgi:hypothetical protein
VGALEVAQAVVDVGEGARDGARAHRVPALVLVRDSQKVRVLSRGVVGGDAGLVDLGVLGESREKGV